MTLAAGTRLGPYEILSPLGAGGMGEVYRARDTRLGREVAVKVLPTSFSDDSDRLRRFELEARAASALNHPNIVTLHDIGQGEGAPYVVTELLEGETLRSRLATGALSPRKVTEYGLQIAQGLAAAHEKGIVHRDLKPENVFVTEDGRVKILDFGLAKLIQPEAASSLQTSVPTASVGTEPGVVMGTVGYMSPEQVKGLPVDHRSDIFSFGAILYEMLCGRRAFKGDSAVEIMSAILKEDPPELSETNKNLSPGLERLVWHCLEKAPAQRFQSAGDLAYDLENLSSVSGAGALGRVAPPSAPRWRLPAALAALTLAGLAGWFVRGRPSGSSPTYQQVTYRRGLIYGSRFAPDGQTIVYAASWNGAPFRIFSTQVGSTESRDLGLPDGDLLSVSSSGELAVCLGRKGFFSSCKLARVPLAGGAPREMADDVYLADWAPDGKDLVVARRLADRSRLEYPLGKTLYETSNAIYSPRFSPRGDLVAFAEEDLNYSSSINVVDLSGKKRTLTKGTLTRDLAWAPEGKEVWFGSADRGGLAESIHAVDLSGRERLVRSETSWLVMSDVSRDGRALITTMTLSSGMEALLGGKTNEVNVSWLDYSTVDAVSPDGRSILFDEWGEGGGRNGSVYLRTLDAPAAVRLAEGNGLDLSPDGRQVLATAPGDSKELVLLPTGTGQPRSLGRHGLEATQGVFSRDGAKIYFIGRAQGHGWRLWEQELLGGTPKPISSEGVDGGGDAVRLVLSPDRTLLATRGPGSRIHLYPVAGGDPRPLPGCLPGEDPILWNPDSRSLLVYDTGTVPARVYRIEIASGRRELWKTVGPSDLAGVQRIQRIVTTPDATSTFYSVERVFNTIFIATGLK